MSAYSLIHSLWPGGALGGVEPVVAVRGGQLRRRPGVRVVGAGGRLRRSLETWRCEGIPRRVRIGWRRFGGRGGCEFAGPAAVLTLQVLVSAGKLGTAGLDLGHHARLAGGGHAADDQPGGGG